MQKTLGGDRLGSGKKMKVELHGYERSTHDLGYVLRTTMSAGTIVPFMKELALPGDTFDINLDCDVKTHPTIGPLFGSYKVQLDVFQAPIRLYHALLHNNTLGIGLSMKDVYLPVIELMAQDTATAEDLDNSQIHPSCILSHLGIRGVGMSTNEDVRQFNAIPWLAYWDIYKNYFANKQEEIGAVIHYGYDSDVIGVTIAGNSLPKDTGTVNQSVVLNDLILIDYTGGKPSPSAIKLYNNTSYYETLDTIATELSDDGSTVTYRYYSTGNTYKFWKFDRVVQERDAKPNVTTFPLENIDLMRQKLLAFSYKGTAFVANRTSPALPPYTYLDNQGINDYLTKNQEGLGIKTYQSDLFNNWLQTEWIDGTNGINTISAIDVSSGLLHIDTINLAKKVYDVMNRIAVSGGSYDDWLDVTYGHERYTRASTPMYMGGLIKELVFQEVVSVAGNEVDNVTQPLGTLAGKGTMAKKHKGGQITIKVDEPSYIIGVISLTPRVDYSQGNDWDNNLVTMDDLHKPGLDGIGFQELITDQMAWWDTKYNTVADKWEFKSAGKQPAWVNYMTNVNRVRGNFAIASNEMFMTLNRRFENEAGAIKDLTTYIDPSKFNFIFAQTSLDAQNFWAQIAVDITARRKMSARVMPNL